MKKAIYLASLFWLILFLSPAFSQVPTPSTNAAIVGAKGVTPFDCSGTITTGGTSQYLIPYPSSSSPATTLSNVRGWMIMNVDTTAEGLCINFTPTATGSETCSTAGFYFMQPATATASGGSYSSQLGFGTTKNPTIVAATGGHKFSCTYW